jgi:predicted nucleic acid-binding protein
MAVQYKIQAEVVDIQSDIPKAGDVFFVDTNVWFWMTYPRAKQAKQPPRPYQRRSYPAYFKKARKATAKLYHCGLSFAELAHQIEKVRQEIFVRTSGRAIGTKEFRHNYALERIRVVTAVQTVWRRIKKIAAPIEALIDEATTDAALTRLLTQPVDGYDLFILEAIAKAGVVQVITDDGDFATVPGIQVFTSNQNVILSAQNQGKLLTR